MNMPKYAKFYKCSLQVNPSSYSKYRGETAMDEDSYNSDLIKECEANKIQVIGLADHENVTSSGKLRKVLQSHEILVFPGFEITSSEHIHIICLFSNDISTEKLKSNLIFLMGDPNLKLNTTPSEKALAPLWKKLMVSCMALHLLLI